MKLAVLGGSTPHTAALLEALLATWTPGLPPLELVLAGGNPERLTAVAGFCARRAAASSAQVQVRAADGAAQGCAGAAVVVFQVRAGGLEAREQDERFPVEFGVPGDEGIGPGGLAAALRSFPLLEELAPALPEHALVLVLSNPLTLCTRRLAELRQGPVVGVCELPGVTLAQALGREPGPELQARYCGLNHQGF